MTLEGVRDSGTEVSDVDSNELEAIFSKSMRRAALLIAGLLYASCNVSFESGFVISVSRRAESDFILFISFAFGVRLKITSRIRLELSKQKLSTFFWISEDRSKVASIQNFKFGAPLC